MISAQFITVAGAHCPAQYQPLMDWRECREAAKSLGFQSSMYSNLMYSTWGARRPQGCFFVTGLSVFFNTGEGGNALKNDKIVCTFGKYHSYDAFYFSFYRNLFNLITIFFK